MVQEELPYVTEEDRKTLYSWR